MIEVMVGILIFAFGWLFRGWMEIAAMRRGRITKLYARLYDIQYRREILGEEGKR